MKIIKVPLVIKNSGLYTIVQILQKGISLFLLPVYTSYLTIDEYGYMNVIASVTSFLSIFLLLSLDSAAARFHFLSSDRIRQAKTWGTILFLVIWNSIILGGLCIVFHKWIIDPFTEGISFFPLVLFAILTAILNPVYTFFQQWLQACQQGVKYTINSVTNFIVITILNLTFVVLFNKGILGVFLGPFIASILFFIYSIITFLPHVKLKYDRVIAKNAYKYSLPLLPHSLLSVFTGMSDRIIINNLIGATSTGLYGVASQFGGLLNFITVGVNRAFGPWFMNKMSSDRADLKSIYNFSIIAIYIYSLLAMTISFFSPELIRLMTTSAFHDAWKTIPFLCFANVFTGMYYFFVAPLFLKNTKYVIIISLLTAIASVTSNFLFIPIFDEIGAGIALMISQVVSCVVAFVLSRYSESDIKYPIFKLFGIVISSLLLAMTIFYIEILDIKVFIKIVIKFSILAILAFFIYFINRREIGIVIAIIKK